MSEIWQCSTGPASTAGFSAELLLLGLTRATAASSQRTKPLCSRYARRVEQALASPVPQRCPTWNHKLQAKGLALLLVPATQSLRLRRASRNMPGQAKAPTPPGIAQRFCQSRGLKCCRVGQSTETLPAPTSRVLPQANFSPRVRSEGQIAVRAGQCQQGMPGRDSTSLMRTDTSREAQGSAPPGSGSMPICAKVYGASDSVTSVRTFICVFDASVASLQCAFHSRLYIVGGLSLLSAASHAADACAMHVLCERLQGPRPDLQGLEWTKAQFAPGAQESTRGIPRPVSAQKIQLIFSQSLAADLSQVSTARPYSS